MPDGDRAVWCDDCDRDGGCLRSGDAPAMAVMESDGMVVEEMNREVFASSATGMWETPQDLFDRLSRVFHFDLDVCATAENAKCDRYFSEQDNGLNQPWDGVCWMNPPYGKTISQWMRKAYEESRKGATVVCLVPARTDAAWWHDWAMKGDIHFLRGRLKFGNSKYNAPFPSAIVVFSEVLR